MGIISAKAIITAEDKTGAAFDKVAAKMKSVTSSAKALEGIKPFAGAGHWGDSFSTEAKKLGASAREIAKMQQSLEKFNAVLKSGGPIKASTYFEAIDKWKGKTLSTLRDIRAGFDETEHAHKKFFKSAGHFALKAAGIGGGAYVAERGIHSIAKAASERQREAVRYEQMGLTPKEHEEGEKIAGEIAVKYPSISRTETLADLRKNASRLGGFDRAKAIADVYARAKISNRISGGDEHELEQVVRAAEGAGAANTPDQFSSFLTAFARAKAANPDYTGNEFGKDFRAAGAAKYGLGKDYMENVFPVLASHTPGFGVKLATSNSALIGGRQTAQARKALKRAGLLDKKGNLVDAAGYQENPYEWTQKNVRPILEKKGVHFGEHMSEEDKRTTSAWATKTFSAKNTADQIIVNLLDRALVERARQRKTEDIGSVPQLQSRDSELAMAAVKKQSSDFATALLNLQPVIDMMNAYARTVGKITNDFTNDKRPGQQAGRVIGGTIIGGGAAAGGVLAARAVYQWFTGGTNALNVSAGLLDKSAAELMGAARMLAGGKKMSEVFPDPAKAGLGADGKPGLTPEGKPAAPGAAGAKPSIWSRIGTGIGKAAPFAMVAGGALVPAAVIGGGVYGATTLFPDDDESADKRRAHGKTVRDAMRQHFADNRARFPEVAAPVVSPTTVYGTGVGNQFGPVTATLTGSAEVKGEATIKVLVEASSELLKVAQQADAALKLAGSVNANGPGSTGRSSPDAAAPWPSRGTSTSSHIEDLMQRSFQSAGAAAIIAQEQPFGQSRLALMFKPLQVIDVGQIVGGPPIDGDGVGQQFGAFNPYASDGTENAVGISLYRVVTAAGSTVRSPAVVRDAEVYHRSVVWPNGITAAQKADAIKQLYEAGIVIK